MSRPFKEWSFIVVALAFGAIAVVPACSGNSTATIVSGDSGTTCGNGSQICGVACTTVARDPENCGACGNKCGVGQVCFLGACGATCGAGTTQCGQSCIDMKADGQNCGACGTKCSAGEVCSGGKCGLSCQAGLRVTRLPDDPSMVRIDAPDLRIIDEELWSQVSSRIDGRSVAAPNRRGRTPSHLLTGLAFCGACGRGMKVHSRGAKRGPTYLCRGHHEEGVCKNALRRPVDEVEGHVIDSIAGRLPW